MLRGAAAAVIVVGGGAIALGQTGGSNDSGNIASGTSSKVSDQSAPSGSTDNGSAGGIQSLTDTRAGEVVDNGSIQKKKATLGVAGEMSKPENRQKCISDMPQRPLAGPTAVQEGTWKDEAAYAFVFPTDTAKVRLIIVKADDCSVVFKDVEETP